MAGEYRPRHPERTVLYRVLFHHFERFQAEYETRFEKEYGFLRPVIKEVVERYLDCGNPKCGFARIRCPDCGEERFVMFSCRTRGFCPSCHAKRLEEWGEWMRETLLLLFLEPEGKIGYRYGQNAAEQETTDYLEFITHLKLTFVADKPPRGPVFEQVALLAALMEAMRTAKLPLRPVLMETCKRHHECGRGERGVRIATDLEREGGYHRLAAFSPVRTDNPPASAPDRRILCS